ncbi:MAG: translation initiation factor IF-2 N-terminal domain-containing protein, partial [Clostridiales bacterium]|nr:translation initiation factor IF-2 N-terminal domain-containing protein [Clostridiales bacterium]
MNSMAGNGIKVSQIAKDLKVTGKDVVERLAACGIEVKGTSVLSEEQLGLIFDIYTELYDVGDAPIEKPPLEEDKPAETETLAEDVTEKPEEKTEILPEKQIPETQNVAEEKKESAEEAPKVNPRRQNQPKTPKKSRKAEEKVVEIPQDNEKEYVIKADDAKKVRYVDTRTATVELDKIETRERLEDMVTDDDVTKLEHGRGGKKHGKKQQNNKEKEIKQQSGAPKKKEKAVPTEIEI